MQTWKEHILLIYYRKDRNTVQTRKKLCEVYEEGVLTVYQCQNWFSKFHSNNFDIKDVETRRSIEANEDIK